MKPGTVVLLVAMPSDTDINIYETLTFRKFEPNGTLGPVGEVLYEQKFTFFDSTGFLVKFRDYEAYALKYQLIPLSDPDADLGVDEDLKIPVTTEDLV